LDGRSSSDSLPDECQRTVAAAVVHQEQADVAVLADEPGEVGRAQPPLLVVARHYNDA